MWGSRMTIPVGTRKQIEMLIRDFVSDTSADGRVLRSFVVRVRALPLFLDMGGFYAIRPNGEIVSQSWDDDDVRVEDDPRIRNVVLFQGSKKYAELAPLIPERPPAALECHFCAGSGLALGIESGIESLVCYCGGLGWLPPGSGKE